VTTDLPDPNDHL
jgi:hypothetical protein